MSGYNRVVLMGNLTRDPELRKTNSGLAVTDLSLATNERYKAQSGEIVEKVCYVDIVAWGRQAETCVQYLTKGRPVLVEGRLQLDKWQTENGEARSKLRVKADRVQFLSNGKNGNGNGEQKEGEAAEEEADALPF